eukprot:gene15070-biopygen2388
MPFSRCHSADSAGSAGSIVAPLSPCPPRVQPARPTRVQPACPPRVQRARPPRAQPACPPHWGKAASFAAGRQRGFGKGRRGAAGKGPTCSLCASDDHLPGSCLSLETHGRVSRWSDERYRVVSLVGAYRRLASRVPPLRRLGVGGSERETRTWQRRWRHPQRHSQVPRPVLTRARGGERRLHRRPHHGDLLRVRRVGALRHETVVG